MHGGNCSGCHCISGDRVSAVENYKTGANTSVEIIKYQLGGIGIRYHLGDMWQYCRYQVGDTFGWDIVCGKDVCAECRVLLFCIQRVWVPYFIRRRGKGERGGVFLCTGLAQTYI